jgi:sarcosine oxidase subunit delta
MKIMYCPLNGPRNLSEFVYGGEVTAMPDPASCPLDGWVEYLHFPVNEAGVVREWWCHGPTSYWFIAERDSVSDEILRTYPATELFGVPPAPAENES